LALDRLASSVLLRLLPVQTLLFQEALPFFSAQKVEGLHQPMLGQFPTLAGVYLLAVAVGLAVMLGLVGLGLCHTGRLVLRGPAGVAALALLAFRFLTAPLQAMRSYMLAVAVVVLAFLVKAPMAPLALHLSIEEAVVAVALLAQMDQLLLGMRGAMLAHMEEAVVAACLPLLAAQTLGTRVVTVALVQSVFCGATLAAIPVTPQTSNGRRTSSVAVPESSQRDGSD
jgi:hypothetical protein